MGLPPSPGAVQLTCAAPSCATAVTLPGAPGAVAAAFRSKVAVKLSPAAVTTSQLPVPVQAPVQPVKTEPAAGVASRRAEMPTGKDPEQVAPQLRPAGVEVTV